MGLPAELFFSAVMCTPLVVSTLVDRIVTPRLSRGLATLVFPLSWALFDYLYSFMYGLGDVFSPALTQFDFAPLAQLSSVTGIYGITFLIGWFGSVGALLWQQREDIRVAKRPVSVFMAVLTAVLMYGSARLATFDHVAPTVRVASITVPHVRDYWEAIVDKGTPEAEAHLWTDELARLEDELFAQSEHAAHSGAPILFWSEAAAVLYEDHEQALQTRAIAFAVEHSVYLQTATLVMHYDDEQLDNRVTLITPEGNVAYTYLKSQTWYPTESDYVIHSFDTPFGRLSSVICFDLDVPGWMQQVAAMNVDILLVPGFDTLPISPYHTQVGLFRAIEGGYSIVRGVADGTSMTVDPLGRTLALSDSFRTQERIMFSDVPTARVTTLYSLISDSFIWLCFPALLALLGLAFRGDRSVS
jgi:apolipoprotein N-acyltransferase